MREGGGDARSLDSRVAGSGSAQVASLYPVSEREAARLEVAVPAALAACERSFSRIRNKYYAGADGAAVLDPLHGCQWAQFLYRLARALYLTGGGGGGSPCPLCDKVLRAWQGPLVSGSVLPGGTTRGLRFRSPFGGGDGPCPVRQLLLVRAGVHRGQQSWVLSRVRGVRVHAERQQGGGGLPHRDFAIISANAFVKDEDIPSGSIVFGQSPHLVIKENRLEYVKNYAESVFRY